MVWVMMFAHFSNNWGHFCLLSWLPSYFSEELHVDLTHAALVALIPPLASVVISTFLAAPLADGMISRGVPVTRVSDTPSSEPPSNATWHSDSRGCASMRACRFGNWRRPWLSSLQLQPWWGLLDCSHAHTWQIACGGTEGRLRWGGVCQAVVSIWTGLSPVAVTVLLCGGLGFSSFAFSGELGHFLFHPRFWQ